jgi:hypothetical protein
MVRGLGAWRNLRSNKKFAVEKWQKLHFLNNHEKEKWIEDYVDRETTVARKQVEVRETAIRQGQEDMTYAERAGLPA